MLLLRHVAAACIS